MSENTIFFSYGRENTAFVMKLATELREAGANIWLDQLDIKPGTRWDSSIEQALQSADTLLVVLSEDSVSSQNVMDEVSYALETKMTVVPVLMEQCDIPFRIRRLQYADFTSDYQKGLKTLASALHLEKDVTKKLVGSGSNQQPVTPKPVEPATPPKPEKPADTPKGKTAPPPAPAPAPEQKKSKTPIYIAAAVVILGILAYSLGIFDSESEPDTPLEPDYALDWQSALSTNSPQAYVDYIQRYGGDNEHYSAACTKLGEILQYAGYVQFSESDGTELFALHDYIAADCFTGENYMATALTDMSVRSQPIAPDYPDGERIGDVVLTGDIIMVVERIPSGDAYWASIDYVD